MRTALLILLAAAGPAFAAQTVWKWVDEQGVPHYSDRPVPGAVKMELSTGSRWNPSTPPPTPAPPAQPSGPVYQNFEIWQPGDQQTLVNTAGQVTVNIRVDPQPQPGHTLSLYLDGKRVEGFAPNTLSYELTDVPRGLHSLTAAIHDQSGEAIAQSPQVTFTVRQESTAQPPVGPALRPPPKPKQRTSNKLSASQPSYAALHGAPVRIDPRTNAPVVPPPKPPAPNRAPAPDKPPAPQKGT